MKTNFIRQFCMGAALCATVCCGSIAQAQNNSGMAAGMSGGMAAGMNSTMSQPREVTGILLRQYVDVAGNTTAMDIRTDQGVRQVRLSPSVPQSDPLLSTYRRGAPVSITGMVTAGVPTYEPNGPLNSGLLMGESNMLSGQTLVGSGTMGTATSTTTSSSMMGMPALSASALPRTMDLSATNASAMAQLAQSPVRGIVRLRDGRVTVVRELNGVLFALNPDDHKPMRVTASGNGFSLSTTGMYKGARVTTITQEMSMDMSSMGNSSTGSPSETQ